MATLSFRRVTQFAQQRRCGRRPPAGGKALMMVVISLPALFGVAGLVFDAGLMEATKQNLQHAADAASSAAARDLALGKSQSAVVATVQDSLTRNGFADASFLVNTPPVSGPFAGRSGFVEVTASTKYDTKIMPAVGGATTVTAAVRSVAGRMAASAGAALVVLDPEPPPITIPVVPLVLPLSYPAILGGLEVLGVGTVRVDGAVHVNTEWGGVDELGNVAGAGHGPPYAISCTPLLALTRLKARDVRVVGGVENKNHFSSFIGGQANPLKAGRLAVPDPLKSVPPPSKAADASIVTTNRGGVRVLQLPLLFSTTLQPGVYDWIEIISGNVTFAPGVYIIRNVNPLTGISLNIAGGIVKADGVLFYITNSSSYDAVGGSPDSGDGESEPANTNILNLLPSIVINGALPGSSFTPLNSAASPFDGMLIYQRRRDYRPIVIVYQNQLGNPAFDGTIYAKWGHVAFIGDGTHDMKIVAGSARLVSLLGLTLAPSETLPPAYDVFPVE